MSFADDFTPLWARIGYFLGDAAWLFAMALLFVAGIGLFRAARHPATKGLKISGFAAIAWVFVTLVGTVFHKAAAHPAIVQELGLTGMHAVNVAVGLIGGVIDLVLFGLLAIGAMKAGRGVKAFLATGETAAPREAARPVAARPVAKAVGTQAVGPTPVAAKPVVAQPVVAKPVVVQPVVAQPVVAKPVVAQPVMAKPVIAHPVVAQPVVAKPVVAVQPVAARPVAPTPAHAPAVVVTPTIAPAAMPVPHADEPLTLETTPLAAVDSVVTAEERPLKSSRPPEIEALVAAGAFAKPKTVFTLRDANEASLPSFASREEAALAELEDTREVALASLPLLVDDDENMREATLVEFPAIPPAQRASMR